MRLRITLFALAALLLTLPIAAQGSGGTKKAKKRTAVTMTFRFDQGAIRPKRVGDWVGNTYTTQLTHFNITPQFGKGAGARVGEMTFSYVWTKGSECSAVAVGECRGYIINLRSITKFPGGTLRASSKRSPILAPYIVNVEGGTGRYAGAKGKIIISTRNRAPKIVYKLSLAR